MYVVIQRKEVNGKQVCSMLNRELDFVGASLVQEQAAGGADFMFPGKLKPQTWKTINGAQKHATQRHGEVAELLNAAMDFAIL